MTKHIDESPHIVESTWVEGYNNPINYSLGPEKELILDIPRSRIP